MTCPADRDLLRASMNVLAENENERMLAHVQDCGSCREKMKAARRGHIELLRTYEAMDRRHDERRDHLMASLADELPRPVATRRSGSLLRGLGDNIMRLNTPTGRRAAVLITSAAAVVIAAVVLSTPEPKSAFASAIQYFQQARTIICRMTMPGAKAQGVALNVEGKMTLSSEHGSYVEIKTNGMVLQQQYTPLEGPSIMVSPASRSYFELDLRNFTLGEDDRVARTPAAWIQRIREMEDNAHTELGNREINGIRTIGFEIDGSKLGFAPPAGETKNSASMKIWVDEAGQRPVEICVTVPQPNSDEVLTVVMDEFAWNEPVSADIFEPNIPEGFIKLDLKFMRPSEETLLHTLKKISELTGGKYTKTLQSVTTITELHSLISTEAKSKLDDQEALMQMALEIASGCQYYMQLVQQGREPEYFGDKVTAGDAGEVLLRWKLEEGGERVIYGDLRVETVPALNASE